MCPGTLGGQTTKKPTGPTTKKKYRPTSQNATKKLQAYKPKRQKNYKPTCPKFAKLDDLKNLQAYKPKRPKTYKPTSQNAKKSTSLQIEDFSKKIGFQEAFKFSPFFFVASIFNRCWLRLGLQHGAILGAKTPQNRKNDSNKKGGAASQERSWIRTCF